MKKVFVLILVVAMAFSAFAQGQTDATANYPNRSLLLIVPFGAGGATDLIARATQPKMEEILGQPLAVQNMPGGASAIGNEYVMDQPHDGYTILCEPTDIVSIAVMGQSSLTYKDWSMIGVAASVPGVICVNPKSEIKTIEQLTEIMKTKKLVASSSDVGCAFTRCCALYCNELGLTLPEFIPSGGGYNAAVSAMKGEVDISLCGLPECIELIRGGELVPLAYFGNDDVDAGNGITVRAIGKVYPGLADYLPFGGWVGMAVPADTPQSIKDKLIDAYRQACSDSSVQSFFASKTFIPVNFFGADADAYVKTSSQLNAYIMYDLGFTKTDPATVGIERLN